MHIVYVALAAAGLAAAHPHQHGHLHHQHEKRDATPVVETVMISGPTVVMYSLDGNIISESEVKQGIANGTLVWANGAPKKSTWTPPAASPESQADSTPAAVSTPAPAPTTTTTTSSTTTTQAPVQQTTLAAPPAPVVTPATTTTTTNTNANSVSKSSNNDNTASVWSSANGLDTPFPDGQLDCSEFPSAYGALNIDWMNLGGWIGIQNPGSLVDGGYADITTAAAGSTCSEGNFCSYACPAGYQKTQWPSTQGSTAQSVGGLQCTGGKLHLTNSALSDKLCMTGTTAVTVKVQNELGQVVSVCRTDYPGTEAETVPLQVNAGSTQPLTCPDTSNYYKWQGQPTSAQYYVNPAGVGVEDACKWGDGSSDTGNWAPLNIGVGYSNGMAYVGMLPNKPTTDATLDYKVTLSGGDLGQSCTYQNGMYYSDIISGGSSADGCTISASSGTITYVFSSS
ncbi:glycoside hydrolase family 132 protein [Myriangium duriaei CBS 260.36]|uniref:Glycoside hydrolase family 132 protein n=1 Tax=Myriangium duriaei CBS 260.36 TaxID=1168546 RepID=A0A9P4J2N4_9PEZI|nr:glycoside hydrolase family 132 protein [Myriangium duriaei CBS 260.36]